MRATIRVLRRVLAKELQYLDERGTSTHVTIGVLYLYWTKTFLIDGSSSADELLNIAGVALVRYTIFRYRPGNWRLLTGLRFFVFG